MAGCLSHRGTDEQGIWCCQSVGLGHNMLWTTPESLWEKQPLPSQDEALVLTADARIDNRDELIHDLGLTAGAPSETTDADLILAAYRRWGEGCPERLVGDFAFVIWDHRRRQLFCARDHIGVKGLFYFYSRRGVFAFASEIKGLFEVADVPRRLNESRVADYLAFIYDDLEGTFFREIKRLPPGHWMTVSPDDLVLRRYWHFDVDRELALGSDADYEAAFRELFTEAVRCRMRSTFGLGSTLSGGLDSSSITCMARQLLKDEADRRLHTFSAIFPSLPKEALRVIDERRYMETVLAGGGLEAHQIRADELDPLGDLGWVLWHQDEPHVPFNLYLHLGMYRCASQHGVRVLLDGFDGDTTVSHGYQRLPELARTFRWLTLAKQTRALMWRVASPGLGAWWKITWARALQPLVPPSLGLIWQRIRHPNDPPWGGDSIIDKAFARRIGLDQRVRSLRAAHFPGFQGSRHAHLLGLTSPLLPIALELADKAAAGCGLEPRYPFFDRRLMAYCLAVPEDLKLRDGWNRFLFRRSMQGVLPPEIQWRASKGNLSPNFHRGLLRSGLHAVATILSGDGGPISGYLDMVALKSTCERYQAQQSDADGMMLFAVATLWTWLARSDLGR